MTIGHLQKIVSKPITSSTHTQCCVEMKPVGIQTDEIVSNQHLLLKLKSANLKNRELTKTVSSLLTELNNLKNQHMKSVSLLNSLPMLSNSFKIKEATIVLKNMVGKGSHGACYSANYNGNEVCAKLYLKNVMSSADPEFEASILANLPIQKNLPHFIGYVEQYLTDDKKEASLLLMNYYSFDKQNTCTLYDFIINHCVQSPSMCIKLMTGLCNAVASLHKVDIIHSDIKLNNILVEVDNNVILIDYSCARHETSSRPSLGFPKTKQRRPSKYNWIPPDGFYEGTVFTKKSDIYQIGYICHFLGKEFRNSKIQALGKNIMTFRWSPLKIIEELNLLEETFYSEHFLSPRLCSSIVKEIEKKKLIESVVKGSLNEGDRMVIGVNEKGRAVFAKQRFVVDDFVVEYKGELVTKQEMKRRDNIIPQEIKMGYAFFFFWKGEQLCIDATKEPEDGLNNCGRLINHSHKNPNLSVKMIEYMDKPKLVMQARKLINIGDELLYDYNDTNQKIIAENRWLRD